MKIVLQNLTVKDHVKLYIHLGQASLGQRSSRGDNTYIKSSLIVLIMDLARNQIHFETTSVLHSIDWTMPYPHKVFAHRATQPSTTEHHHVHLDDDNDDYLIEHARTKCGPDNAYSLSDGSDEEQDCSHDPVEDDEDDEDGDEIWEEEDYMSGDDYDGHIHCIEHQRCSDDVHDGIMSHGIVRNNQYFDSKEHIPSLHANTTMETPESKASSLK